MKRLICCLSLALLLTACKEEVKNAPKAAQDPELVTPPASLVQQLKVAPAGKAAMSEILRVAGRVDFDEKHVARIGAPVTGRVTELNAELGQAVKAGDTLAQLHSTELGQVQLAYIKARSQVALHSRAVERAKLLLSADVIGSAELQKRESELEMAHAELRAAADQLRVLGVTPQFMSRLGTGSAVTTLSQVVATLPGVVVERKVVKGQVVQPADALFTVADLSRVWITAQVPEGDAALAQVGQEVAVDIPALGGTPVKARLTQVGDIVNAETRTVTVRTELDNRELRLKPAMLATMLIQGAPKARLAVPAAAIVREDNADHVFVSDSKEGAPARYRLTKVKLGLSQDGLCEVKEGLKGGENIVIDGAFHLNNERKRAELEGG